MIPPFLPLLKIVLRLLFMARVDGQIDMYELTQLSRRLREQDSTELFWLNASTASDRDDIWTVNTDMPEKLWGIG